MDFTCGLLKKKTFPDSDIAKRISIAHSKTYFLAIITSVLAPCSVDATLKSLEKHENACFGIATDGCSHDGLRLFPVVIHYCDWRNGGLQHKLIEFKNKPPLSHVQPFIDCKAYIVARSLSSHKMLTDRAV